MKRALNAVLAGKIHVSKGFGPNRTHHSGEDPSEHPKPSITSRQREVLELIATGRNTKEIAGVLRISRKTVEVHRTQLMKRLRIHNVTGLVRYALRTGLARLED